MTSGPEPGYCIGCGVFHLVTPVEGRLGGACQDCIATRRLEPPEPGPRHVCNTGDRLKPGHPEYRRCSCGQWFHSAGGYWYRVRRPPAHWLRIHGVNADELWACGEDDGDESFSFTSFFTSIGTWRYWIRSLIGHR